MTTPLRATLWEGDCLPFLRHLKPRCLDLCVTSPPYEAARTYGVGFKLRGDDWVRWAAVRFMECLRVCRGPVCWVVQGQTDDFEWSATPALLIAELRRRGANVRNPLIFHRVGIPGSGGPDWFRSDYEWVVCATERGGKLKWSDNTAMGHVPKWGPGGEMSNRLSNGSRRNQWGGGEKSSNNRRPGGERQETGRPSHVITPVGAFGNQASSVGRRANGEKVLRLNKQVMTQERDGQHSQTQVGYTLPSISNPGNVIKCLVGGGVMGDKFAHENEAPFPESLAEFLIRSLCPPGGTVLDPFLGSGTTAKVALMHGRNAVGIDVRGGKGGLETAEKRLRAWTEKHPEIACDIRRREWKGNA